MSLYQLKPKFQDQLRPVSNSLVAHNFTANQVTVSAVLLSVGTAYVIAKPATEQQALWLLLPSSLFVRMALNAIDGMMAREHGQASTLGAVLNEVGDIIADTVLITSLAPHVAKYDLRINSERQTGTSKWFSTQRHISSMTALSMSTELLGIASNTILGARANQGPLGKSDRALILGVLGAVMGSKLPLSRAHFSITPLFILTEALLLKTCLNRIRYMVHLYLMHQPPTLRSVTRESKNNSLSINIASSRDTALSLNTALPNNYTDNAYPLEFKEMPTTPKCQLPPLIVKN